MRALVTGVGGFAGGHLARCLAEKGHLVSGLYRRERFIPRLQALAREFPGQVRDTHFFQVDVREYESVREAVATAKPDLVFHLAAVTFAPHAETSPGEAFVTNVVGTMNVLRAARAIGCRVLVVSTGEAYGASASSEPLGEATPLKPVSVYGMSKAAAEMAVLHAHWHFGQEVIIARPFNHTGPGQSDRFVCPAFASQLAAIEAGMREPVIRTGNLDAMRDFCDVRDVVRGYLSLAEAGRPAEAYNLCSGRAVRVEDILQELIRLTGIKVSVRKSSDRVRQREIPCLVGSFNKAAAACGWSPELDLMMTLRELLDQWREEVRRDGRIESSGSLDA